MTSKLVLKDVGRILDIDHNLINTWNKELPSHNGEVMDLADAVEELPVFKRAKEQYPELFELALDLQSMPRASGVHPCFDENTKVVTLNKTKKIKHVVVGDYVLTHKNRYRKVLEVIQNPTDKIYTLITHKLSLETKATGNHPYWVSRLESKNLGIHKDGQPVDSFQMKEPLWKPLKDLKPNVDYVCIPKDKNNRFALEEKWPGDSFSPETHYVIDGVLWLQVKSISSKPSNQIVYNLSVEEDHSYTANGAAVKNCGIQISPVPLDTNLPLRKGKLEGQVVTQYEGIPLESLGYVKFDILGLKNLSVLRLASEYVLDRHGVDVDINNIEPDDTKVYDMIKSGNTLGIFQLELNCGSLDEETRHDKIL